MPHSPVPLSRREFGVLSTLAAAALGLSACASTDPAKDELWHLLDAARADVRDLDAGAGTGGGAALTRVSAARAEHSERLAAEIRRLHPDGSDPGAPDPTAPTRPAPEPTPLDVATARDRLAGAADDAAAAALEQSDYRAELCASISAACLAASEVLLA